MKPLARWRIGVFVVCGLAVLLAAAAWALRDAAPRSREAARPPWCASPRPPTLSTCTTLP